MLKLADTENKVAGGNFVSERFTYLRHAERYFFTGGAGNVLKVYKNALRGLGAEVKGRCAVLGYALKGLEHKVKLAYIGKIVAAAVGAGNALILNILHHFLVAHGGGVIVKAVLGYIVFNKLIRSVAGLAALAVHKRVGKAA